MKTKFEKANRKVILGILTLLLILAIVTVSSFIPFIIDPSKIGTIKFLTDELIIIVITIAVTITVMFISQASNQDNPRSDICKARVEFMESMKLLKDLTRFYQWVKRVLRVRDKQEIVEREMMRIGLEVELYELSDNELKALVDNPQKYGDKFYKRIEKEQYNEIRNLKKKMIKMKFVSPNYYTTCKNIMPNRTNSERASAETKKKISYVILNLFAKIILTLMFAMIVGSLVINTAGGGEGAAQQAWLDFLSRMFAFTSSAFLGYTIGTKLNDIDAFYIRNRIEAHILYREDKTFVEIDEAKEEYIERVKNEQVLLNLKEREETKFPIVKNDKVD